jgi:hypothetical protein
MVGQEIILAPVLFASRCPDYLTHARLVPQAELLDQRLPALQSRISNRGKLARPVSWSQGRDPRYQQFLPGKLTRAVSWWCQLLPLDNVCCSRKVSAGVCAQS